MRWLFVFFLVTAPGLIYCQDFSINDELMLANYLLNNNNNEESIHHLNKTFEKFSDKQEYRDTINFLLGFAYYQQKELAKSNEYFLKVSNSLASYNKARFTAAYNFLYNQKYSEAKNLLEQLDVDHGLYSEYKAIQNAGLALLNKKYDEYPIQSKEFSYNYFQIEKEQTQLDLYYQELKNFNPKSKAVAGLMSTVIPGSGKMYAGKLGEGISALFVVSILGAITAENYIKNGLNNYKTITFGSLFSVFYLGNIYGSMVSVKVYRDEFFNAYERKILVNLHIPLRNIFY